MDVYDIAEGVIIEVPEVSKQVFPVHHLVRSPHEVFEEHEFLQRE